MKRYFKIGPLLVLLLVTSLAGYAAYESRERWLGALFPSQRAAQEPPAITGEKPSPAEVPAEVPAGAEAPGETPAALSPGQIVFLGDSITYRWDIPEEIGGCTTVNAGIDGNTTAAMVLRFDRDVISRHPDRVFILGGINDILIAFQYDLVTLDLHLEKTAENVRLMTKLAKKAGIEPVLCSVLPVAPSFVYTPAEINSTVRRLDASIRKIAIQEDAAYLDLWPYLQDPDTKMLADAYSKEDGIHLSTRGYFELLKGITEYLNENPVRPAAP